MAVHALLIEGYHENLKYTDNDIHCVQKTFNALNISSEIAPLDNARCVQQAIEDICSDSFSNDTLMIYYTGHAEIYRNKLQLKIANTNNYYSDYLIVNSLIDTLVVSEFTKMVLILDCCHAEKAKTAICSEDLERIHLLYSSRSVEKSWEIDEFKMSAFSKFMCDALLDLSKRLEDYEKITLSGLDAQIRSRINLYNKEQNNNIPRCGIIGSKTDETVIFTAVSNCGTKLLTKINEYQNNFLECIENCKKRCPDHFSWCNVFLRHNIEMNKYAIPTVSTKEGIPLKLNKFIIQWMESSDDYLALLANVGVGKTSACFYLITMICRGEIKGIYLPVLIPLQSWEEISNQKNVLETIAVFANNQFTTSEIEELIKANQLMIIMDGFDEISAESTLKSIITNFKNLAPFLRLKCKTVLTCRTHYFAENNQIDDVLQGRVPGTDFAGLLLGDEYNFNVVELQEFSEGEILEVIQLSMTNEDADKIWNDIKDIYDLRDLARRAIILKLILNTLPELKKHNNSKITEARLYRIYTYKLLKRELTDRRYVMDIEDLEKFIEYIASLMWKYQRLSINTQEFRKEIGDFYCKKLYVPFAIDQYIYAAQISSFFVRDKNDNFVFCHKSFFEYYIAKYCIRTMMYEEKDYPGWGEKWFDREIASFIADIIMYQENKLMIINLLTAANQATDSIVLWNVLHILSLLDENIIKNYLTDEIKDNLISKAQSEYNCVIIRQYCRIIAKFINRSLAEQLIDKIIEIIEKDSEQNRENNETYFNYYNGKEAACNAFIKHLQVPEPKYDAKLHIYLLGNIAREEYIQPLVTATNVWSESQYIKYFDSLNKAVACIKMRDENLK